MGHFYGRLTFIVGLLLGLLIAFYFKKYQLSREINIHHKYDFQAMAYDNWFKKQGIKRKAIQWDKLRYGNATYYTESDFLRSHVRLLCVFIQKAEENIKAAKATWAKGCNAIESIIIEQRNKMMPFKQNKEKSSWVMLCKLLSQLDTNNFDWLLVVRDTSFVITENLRYYVAPLNPRWGHYFGHAVKFRSTVYNSGNPGYILSNGAVIKFQKLFKKECLEFSYWNKEDFYLGKYLAQLNITPINMADEEGFTTFHPYNWYHVFNPGETYYKDSVFPVKCCSRKSIAFEVTQRSQMYTFDYLFYKLQIFTSGQYGNRNFQDSVPETQPWKEFLQQHNILHDNVSSEEYYKLWENLINDPNSFAANLKKEQLSD